MQYRVILSLMLLLSLAACSHAPEKTADNNPATAATGTESNTPAKHDYPTRDRVQYVLDCIAQHVQSTVKFGGINYVTQYACGCKIDKIAEKLSFEEFESALSGSYLSKLPGESGSVFRNSQYAKDLKTRFKEADQNAEKSCFVK
ncbi:MAG: hypothetical protein WAX77_12840 [Methylococcaceae bacterium]